ncbi:MAG TPA: HAD family phosphatase, partial [Bryobacteraceae bacterium]|nr:HAD family phosphatase [Bryobacteraceae bacterium]
MTRAVLWDLDGTLGDSEEFHWQAWRETMDAEGVPITRDRFRSTFGQRNDSFLPEWLGPNAAPERVLRVAEGKEARYRELVLAHGLDPLPGAAEWVERLASEGWAQAVASSAPRRNVEAMLDALGFRRYFPVFVGAEDVTEGKPDPQVFLSAAARLGVEPAHCVVVEDAAAGIEAARRAGIRSIGIERG